MCRWGCEGLNSTYMCKWCGTRYCKECLKGEFRGLMREESICAKCNQTKCQGKRVEGVLKEYMKDDDGKGGGRGKSAGSSKSASKKGGKSGGKAKKGGGSKKEKKKKKKK